MLATIESATVIGVDACRVHVEIDVSRGFPTFQLVGLPDASIRESRDRVRAAMRNSRLRVSDLAHHDQPRAGRRAEGRARIRSADRGRHARGHRRSSTRNDFAGIVHVGELSLDGSIQPARGVLPIAAEARRNGARALLLPHDNLAEAAVVSGLRLLPVRTLTRSGGAIEPVGRRVARRHPAPQHPSTPGTLGTSGTCPISPTSTARRSRVARSKSPPPAATTC